MSKLIFLHGPLRICLHEDSSSYTYLTILSRRSISNAKWESTSPFLKVSPQIGQQGVCPSKALFFLSSVIMQKYINYRLIKVLNVLKVASQVYREFKKISFPCSNLFTMKKNKNYKIIVSIKKKHFYKKKMINAWAKESLSLQTQELCLLLK